MGYEGPRCGGQWLGRPKTDYINTRTQILINAVTFALEISTIHFCSGLFANATWEHQTETPPNEVLEATSKKQLQTGSKHFATFPPGYVCRTRGTFSFGLPLIPHPLLGYPQTAQTNAPFCEWKFTEAFRAFRRYGRHSEQAGRAARAPGLAALAAEVGVRGGLEMRSRRRCQGRTVGLGLVQGGLRVGLGRSIGVKGFHTVSHEQASLRS